MLSINVRSFAKEGCIITFDRLNSSNVSVIISFFKFLTNLHIILLIINVNFMVLDISEPNVNTFFVYRSINDKLIFFFYTHITEIDGNVT